MPAPASPSDYSRLADDIRRWSQDLGFQQLGITGTELTQAEMRLMQWLDDGCHGEMDYMARYGTRRCRPQELEPGTIRVISVRMDYLPPDSEPIDAVLQSPATAFISRYALGRDYHKLMRKRLQKLADRISAHLCKSGLGEFGYRVFVDSAPVLEKPLAEKAGLGWIGKHTNLINRDAGSWFFLGELYTDLPLPVDQPVTESHCGTCSACIDVCPTGAIIAPYRLDARRCISYLTIELHGAIPLQFRELMGNRIYGCDDCQQVCPWNGFAKWSEEDDFRPRHGLDAADLVELFSWDEATFLDKTGGSAIRRIGYRRWLRNIAVALGNAPASSGIISALKSKLGIDAMVDEHIEWALEQHGCSDARP